MEDKNISERESLKLISKMILQTKEDLNVGSGSTFLVWGYVCCGIGLLVWLLMVLGSIGNVAPCFYTLIPILGFVIDKIVRKKSENGFVKNYSTYMIDSTWMILSGAFGIAAIVCVYFCVMHNMMNALVFFFLGLSLPGIGTAITGVVLKEKCVTVGGCIGILFGIASMEAHVLNMDFGVDWHLVFAASYVVMMIIPGHYLNHKAKKQEL